MEIILANLGSSAIAIVLGIVFGIIIEEFLDVVVKW